MPTGSSLPLIRLPGLEYPANAKLDFGPLERALVRYNEAGFQQARLDREDERIGIARRAEDRTDRDRQVSELAGWASRLDEITDETHRRNIWDRRVAREPRLAQALTSAGMDPSDFRNGPGFLMSQAQDYEQNRLRRAQTNLVKAQTTATQQRGDARIMDAKTRRERAMFDQWQERLGDNPSEEAWNRENQPGGLIHMVFGGPRPFSEAPSLVQEVQSRRSQLPVPGDEEMAGAGLTPEQMQAARQQRALNQIYGRPPANHRWRPDGSVEPLPGYGTAGERTSQRAAQQGLAMLEEASRLLESTGSLEHFFGDRWQLPGTNVNIGGWGEAGRGYRAAEGAVMQLVFALSGKQSTNAEREAFMRTFMPTSAESRETQRWKLQQVRNFFQQAASAHAAGATDEQLRDLLREHTERGRDGPPRPPAAPDQQRQPPDGRSQQPLAPPPVGTVVDGWRFRGGNPGDRSNWERVR